jgi:hypothetical protein
MLTTTDKTGCNRDRIPEQIFDVLVGRQLPGRSKRRWRPNRPLALILEWKMMMMMIERQIKQK